MSNVYVRKQSKVSTMAETLKEEEESKREPQQILNDEMENVETETVDNTRLKINAINESVAENESLFTLNNYYF